MSDFIDFDLVKTHLYVTHSRDDSYIKFLIKAAFRSILNFVDYQSWDELRLENNGLIPEDILHAGLLIIGDMYSNRARQQDVNLYVNQACERLMFPYRKMGV